MQDLGSYFVIAISIPKRVVLGSIKLYQKTLSPDHGWLAHFHPGGYCKFQPTCSMYTYEAVDKLGITRGLLLGCGRIFRCNPFSKGGYDPVPLKKK